MLDSSDYELQSAPELLLKKTKKMPKPPKSPSEGMLEPEPKKMSTKIMIYESLIDLRKGTRKGASLYAIKKHMAERYGVDIEKINHIIKKRLKEGVESGDILQTKGIGASGSFRLATATKTVEKKAKPKKKENTAEKKIDKPKKTAENTEMKPKKKTVVKEKSKKDVEKITKKTNAISKVPKTAAKEQTKKKDKGKVEKTKNKMAGSDKSSSTKKKTLLKRKSIGSIIKAPKMKPKMK